MKDPMYLNDVVNLTLNQSLCNACGMCVKVCPHAVFRIINKKAHIIHQEYCMECGACALNCSVMAISVNSGQGCGCATGIIEGYFNGNQSGCDCTKGC